VGKFYFDAILNNKRIHALDGVYDFQLVVAADLQVVLPALGAVVGCANLVLVGRAVRNDVNVSHNAA